MAPKVSAAAKARTAAKPAKPVETISMIGDWAKSHGKVKKEEESDDEVVQKKPSPGGACKRPASAGAKSDSKVGRDRNKNHHFNKCWGELPKEIQEQFASSSTRQQTVIINTLMEPGEKCRSMVPVWDGKHMFEDCML